MIKENMIKEDSTKNLPTCRTCRIKTEDVYYIDRNGKPCKKPRCKDCHERMLRSPKAFAFNDGFVVAGKGFRFHPKPILEEEAQLEDDRFDCEEIV